jgi:dGTPase
MDFASIYSSKRVGSDKVPSGLRSGFQRDYDRLIFSSAFRRLQNKTQVFPLPDMAFVHNRLTHSLEVASVGRSLGKIVGEQISLPYRNGNEDAYEFYKYELANVIAAACLAHDIGNPAFGHSGEKAISSYFIENADQKIDERKLRSFFSDKEWQDLSNFEGNANALRILTHSFRGRFKGGFGLTYTTIASVLKYPCEATAVDKNFKHRKKFGFFQSEKVIMEVIAGELQMIKEPGEPMLFKRQPFVYLVEAADDICYRIMDMEDGHRLGIISKQEIADLFINVIRSVNYPNESWEKANKYYNDIEDSNESIAFLRAKVINVLTQKAADVFLDNRDAVLSGNFNDTLLDNIERDCQPLRIINKISQEKIYQHSTVMQIEIAGYNVLSELLSLMVPAVLKEKPSHKEQMALKLFPYQFTEYQLTSSSYEKVMSVLDYLSGMTDTYATEMYRRLKGIVIPEHG